MESYTVKDGKIYAEQSVTPILLDEFKIASKLEGYDKRLETAEFNKRQAEQEINECIVGKKALLDAQKVIAKKNIIKPNEQPFN